MALAQSHVCLLVFILGRHCTRYDTILSVGCFQLTKRLRFETWLSRLDIIGVDASLTAFSRARLYLKQKHFGTVTRSFWFHV